MSGGVGSLVIDDGGIVISDSNRTRTNRQGTLRRALAAVAGVTVLAACGSTTTPQTGSGAQRDLQLRPVLSMAPLDSGSCPTAARDAAAGTTPVSACSTDGSTLYSLGAAAVSGGQVSSVSVQDSASGGGAEIDVALDDAGSAALTSVTTELAAKPAPQSQLAIYIHGRVQSAPQVMAPITSGTVVIAGDFTKAQAQQIIDGLAGP